jgi:hypothetical protein
MPQRHEIDEVVRVEMTDQDRVQRSRIDDPGQSRE